MRVTVLGKSPSWQDAGGACSGYLVEEDATALLLDCGNGVFAKLRAVREYGAIDAIVVSHLHADHFLDLVPFAYALTYAPGGRLANGNAEAAARPVLHAPRGAGDVFRRVVGAWGDEDLIADAFDLREYDAGDELEIGALRVRFRPVPHWVATCAVEVRSAASGRRFVYGADSAPNDDIVGFASGADLLMVEATLRRPEADGDRGHLTPGEAGEHGARASARRLVITHFSDQIDATWAQEEAERGFGGPVTAAREGDVYEV